MTTDIEHEESIQDPIAAVEEPSDALEDLLAFMRERVRGNMTRCPGCNLFVPISARRCRHCESDIAANNALVRETLRRIDEMTSRIDDEGRAFDRAWRSMKNRIKRMFGGAATIKGNVSEGDTKRALAGVHAGDQIIVVETHGAWTLVQTAEGRQGWVYSLSTP